MKKISILIFVFVLSGFVLIAQKELIGTIKGTRWIFGISNHIVVDGGEETSLPFNTKA